MPLYNPTTSSYPPLDAISEFYDYDDFMPNIINSGYTSKWGWVSGGGGTLNWDNQESELHPGSIFLTSPAAAGFQVIGVYYSSFGNTMLHGTSMFDSTFIAKIGHSDGDSRYSIGWTDNIEAFQNTDTQVQGPAAAFTKRTTDTNWQCYTASTGGGGATENYTSSGVTHTTGWHRFRIRRISSAIIGFTINNNAEVEVNCTALGTNPAGHMGPMFRVATTVASGKTLRADYVSLRITGLAR